MRIEVSPGSNHHKRSKPSAFRVGGAPYPMLPKEAEFVMRFFVESPGSGNCPGAVAGSRSLSWAERQHKWKTPEM